MLVAMPGNVQGRHLGQQLKAAREKSGLTGANMANELGVNASTVSRWERGERGISKSDVERYLAAAGASDSVIRDISRLVDRADDSVWITRQVDDRNRQMAALLEAEEAARRITYVAGQVIPGLLQTTAYARAIMEAGGVPPGEIRQRVAERAGRREILTRHDAPVCLDVIIDEVVLRRRVASRAVMKGQLEYLLERASLDTVSLRIVPLASDKGPTHDGQFSLIEPVEDGPVVHEETRLIGLFFNDGQDVAIYMSAAENARKMAMSPSDSLGLIADVIKELETTS